MNTDQLDDEEVALTARALSIHRASVRRKLDRLTPGTSEHASTLREIHVTQRAMAKLNTVDYDRVSGM